MTERTVETSAVGDNVKQSTARELDDVNRKRGQALRTAKAAAPRIVRVCCWLAALAPALAPAQDPPAAIDRAVIENLLDVAAQAVSLVDPHNRYLLLVHERKLLQLHQLAEPAISVAGRNINPRTRGLHAPLDYFGLTLVDLATGASEPIPLPRNATIGFPAWSPDGSRFAFTLTTAYATELWIGEPGEGRARKLVDRLNASFGQPCTWMPDGRRVLCRRVAMDHPALRSPDEFANQPMPRADLTAVPGEPIVIDADVVRSLLESRLELIDVASGQRRQIGSAKAFESIDPAPSAAYLLVSRTAEPYPRISGVDPLYRVSEIWDKTGRFVKRLPTGLRATQWHASRPATLVWVERVDGADRVMLQEPPFTAPAREIFRTEQTFSGLEWIENSGAALIREYNAAERSTRVWHVDPDTATSTAARVLQTGRIDEPAEKIGAPITKMNRWGKPVVAVNGEGFYLRGERSDEIGARPFLVHMDLRTGIADKVWEANGEGYEEVVNLLSPDAAVLLTRHQSSAQPPNYFINVRGGLAGQLTDYRHPAPQLRDARRVRLTYARADGYRLSSNLYLPPGYDPTKPLPLVLWAYPRHVGAVGISPDTGAGSGTPGSERFMNLDRAFKLVFLLRGYAVMDDVAMPVIGDASDANDTFIQQIVANAEAAVAAAIDTGYIDGARIGVAGHSYGAFMAANLLAHSRLFGAGVALSGAYNRTLTPFGFQTERRTLWEAPDTYLAMSPFLYSNRIEAPLLLVHGLQDKNAGTSPLQSTQFYQAIRGNGGQAGLLLLPLEGHSYRARESVLQAATAMLNWFDQHL
jgi:dipeptidyl aminopeptidase/acylaminoacyl peptidase